MNLIIAGDLVSNISNEKLFEKGELNSILGSELNEIWKRANYKIFNLEAPISNFNNPIKKCGPNLRNNPEIINGITEMNPTCILLANNHILDFSEIGLKDTTRILDNNNINWIGVGENKNKLKKFFVIDNKVGIYNCCESEFSNVTETTAGANYYDEFEIENDITMLKSRCEYIIIIYHGGKEYYRYPSPYLQKRCRQMIDYGANLIVCQHSHCIGCKEEYKNGTIIYGQGNFVFNNNSNEFWDNSLLIDLDIDNYDIKYIPIKRTSIGTELANENDGKKIINDFIFRSNNIKDSRFLKKKYAELANDMFYNYLSTLHGNNLLYKILNKLCFHTLIKRLYGSKDLLAILNFIECEAHRELLIEGLKNQIKDKK